MAIEIIVNTVNPRTGILSEEQCVIYTKSYRDENALEYSHYNFGYT